MAARKPLFIAIGVHDATGMGTLDGVLEAVADLTAWANSQNYDVVSFDDSTNKVTVAGIKKRLTMARLLDRPRIIVYFCGHGLHVPQDQYWILSAGPDQPGERISVVGFRDLLATYGPRQIAMISDACRTPHVVRGQGESVVRQHRAAAGPVQKDNFFASQDGTASFAVPSREGKPGYCVFTSVLHNALSTRIPDALDALYLQVGREIVSSQSLATYLEKYVPPAAIAANAYQAPQCDPGFRPTDNDYVEFTPAALDGRPPTPPAGGLRALRHDFPPTFDFDRAFERTRTDPSLEILQRTRINRSRSEWRGPFVAAAADRIRTAHRYRHLPKYSVLIASDEPSLLIGLDGTDRGIEGHGPIGQSSRARHFAGSVGFARTRHSSVFIANAGDLFAPVPLFERLWCVIGFGRQAAENSIGGVEVLAWGEPGRTSPIKLDLSPVEALKGLSAGTLTSEEARLLTIGMRNYKNANPLLGIVSAYLYNAVGDVENIRRMCYFYSSNQQDVPFDIAMLANVPLRRHSRGGFFVKIPKVAEVPPSRRRAGDPWYVWSSTPSVSIRVAGLTPVLRVGWQHVRASAHRVHRQCWELTDQLTESPISTFTGARVGDALIDAFRRA